MSQFYNFYENNVIKKLMKDFNYTSIMQVPRIEKIVLNMGIGNANFDKKVMESALQDLSIISGQKPFITRAKRSIAAFKIREGYSLGCKVTLRKKRMWDFFERLVSIAIPRIRDFRGFSDKAFDGYGNYNLGVREQIIFPEIDYDKVNEVRGLNITIVISGKSDLESRALLSEFSFPFCK